MTYQGLDLVFLSPTDAAYMLHFPLRQHVKRLELVRSCVCVCVCVYKQQTECRVDERR
jgi:hypothetical protein